MAILASTGISCSFEGVTDEIGRYPFSKILIDDVYIHSWVINSSTMQCTYLVLCLDKVINLWSNDANLENLHKVI